VGIRSLAFAAAAVLAVGTGLSAQALTGNQRNGIALVVGPDRTGYVESLKRAIKESGRFQLVSPAPHGIRVKMPDLLPVPALTVPQRNLVKGRTSARWLFFGNINRRTEMIEEWGSEVATTSMDISARSLDLDMGDFTPLMTLTGRDPIDLAAQTLKFLRVQHPLLGRVTAVREGTVYLDMGRKDGVDRGSMFIIRHMAKAFGERVGTVAVTSASDWYAVAEMDESVIGKHPQAGDVAVEDTSAILARP